MKSFPTLNLRIYTLEYIHAGIFPIIIFILIFQEPAYAQKGLISYLVSNAINAVQENPESIKIYGDIKFDVTELDPIVESYRSNTNFSIKYVHRQVLELRIYGTRFGDIYRQKYTGLPGGVSEDFSANASLKISSVRPESIYISSIIWTLLRPMNKEALSFYAENSSYSEIRKIAIQTGIEQV